MRSNKEHVWAIEILSSTLTRGVPYQFWFVDTPKGTFELSKRKIKNLSGKPKKKYTEYQHKVNDIIAEEWKSVKLEHYGKS